MKNHVLRIGRNTSNIAIALIGAMAGSISLVSCSQDAAFVEDVQKVDKTTLKPIAGNDSQLKSSDQQVIAASNCVAAVAAGLNLSEYDAPIEKTVSSECRTDILQPGGTQGNLDTGGTGGNVDDISILPPTQPVVPVVTVVVQTPVPEWVAGQLFEIDLIQKRAKADILWVIDSSGSMGWAQNQLASKFSSFANTLRTANIDFRLGVTSLDVCDSTVNAYCPETNLITSKAGAKGALYKSSYTQSKYLVDNSNLAAQFSQLAQIGTSGSGAEHGLSAAKMAIEKSFNNGVNAGFIRSDAALSIIVLSDEEDDGIGYWCDDAWGRRYLSGVACTGSIFADYFNNPSYGITSPWTSNFNMDTAKMHASTFVDFASSKLGGINKFNVNAITGIRGTNNQILCNNPSISASQGPRESGTNYIRAAELTHGVVENICSSNWNSVLNNIGQGTVELSTRIALQKIPFLSSLKVYVNDVLQSSSAFSYESQSNAIVFKVVPPSGSSIHIEYNEAIHP